MVNEAEVVAVFCLEKRRESIAGEGEKIERCEGVDARCLRRNGVTVQACMKIRGWRVKSIVVGRMSRVIVFRFVENELPVLWVVL